MTVARAIVLMGLLVRWHELVEAGDLYLDVSSNQPKAEAGYAEKRAALHSAAPNVEITTPCQIGCQFGRFERKSAKGNPTGLRLVPASQPCAPWQRSGLRTLARPRSLHGIGQCDFLDEPREGDIRGGLNASSPYNGAGQVQPTRAVIADLLGGRERVIRKDVRCASVYTVIAAIRSPRVSPEDLERADMRSCSWPTADGAAFTPVPPLQVKSESTLVNGQVGG